MLAALVALLSLLPVMFLTCGGPTHEEQIREQADRIYTQISRQNPQETCQFIREAIQPFREKRVAQIATFQVESRSQEEMFQDIPQYDRDDVRQEVDSLLSDPCRGQR